MHQPSALEAAEQGGQFLELDGFPDGQPADDLRHPSQEHDDIKKLLDRVVDSQVTVIDLEVQGFPHGFDQVVKSNRQQAFAQSAGDESVYEVAQTVQDQEPHPGEMPKQAL